MVFTPLVAEYFPDFYYRMKRLHQQVGGDTQASEGERLWDYVQKSIYSNRGGGQQFFDRLYAQLHILQLQNEPSMAVESEKFLDTHLREACRKLEIAFPVPPANEDKQQRSVLAHLALCDEGSTSSLSTDSFSTPTRRQAMVSITPSFVDEVFENDAQVMFEHALHLGYTCYRASISLLTIIRTSNGVRGIPTHGGEIRVHISATKDGESTISTYRQRICSPSRSP
jgi:hypothetical protein